MSDYFLRAKLFKTKKRLGQNFLVDEGVIDRIVEEVNPDDTVLEIGPGAGFVTENIVNKAKKVYAVEIDEDAIEALQHIKTEKFKLIHNDILKTQLKDLEDTTFKVIANIPYYITSPILAHLLGEIDDLNNDNRNRISEIVLMVQWEVAQRLVADENAPSKQYGLLSILTQFNADVELIQKVGRKSFYPAPKVDSALVKITINNEPRVKVEDYKFLRKVVKACFATRRKNLKNSLMNAGFNKDAVAKTLETLQWSENVRGETLSIEKLAQLSEELKKQCLA
ncbi:MAG TPA: ribosomal RNA small subunit methyltransferase A [Candidatus Limenecus avicola]|uniref:Ribosomal RNA small subunit methyltransferase A n=1 Tax=Candidatus Limenecus avicola TaxID=2840847 RepID=A0A9D1SS23_9CLOT|nr:ribosomal RNA small subunit methyltransferase A [Candidatus Limenecus avicola]